MSTSVSNTAAAPLTLQQKRIRAILAGIPVRLTVLILVVIWTVPTLGLLVSSFRPAAAIRSTGWWTALFAPFTADWTLANYIQVIGADRMGLAFSNSLLITIPATVIPITIAAFAAFALAWMDFPGRKLAFIIVVGLMVVPLQMSLIPVLRVYTNLRLNGTYLGMWLAHTGFGLPLATYLLYGYISSIPKEILESAHADGASPMLTFTRLIMPLSVPAVASFAIFQFLWVWNDLLVALVFLGTRSANVIVTTRLAELVGSRGQDWHVLTAGAFLTIIVPLFVFLSLQRFFVRGMMAGSVKG
ncbi:MAG: carbohydrate ABC transporter permease [Spirochaetaceae bacterium]|nr:MAG: carbohydrate ABC transporter permease [Spirochaetaceae bacterium]